MALVGFVARHTGLPSLRITSAGPVYAGDRLLTVARSGDVVSDLLAPAGEPVTYRQGARQVTLRRATTSPRFASVVGLNGRGLHRCWWRADGDKTSWSSPASIFTTGAVRWPLTPRPRTGSGALVLWQPEDREAMWELLRSRQPLVISSGAPVLGVPPVRAVVVTKVQAERISPEGAIWYDVDWTEVPLDSPTLRGVDGGTGACPVVTWGEWDAADHAWLNRTYLDVCRLVAGMPS